MKIFHEINCTKMGVSIQDMEVISNWLYGEYVAMREIVTYPNFDFQILISLK